MKFHIEYDSTIDSLIIEVYGIITCDDLLRLAHQIIEHPQFKTNMNQLFDTTKGELHLSKEDIERIASEFMQLENALGLNRRLALAVTRTVDFGMMRQYEVFFQSGPDVMVKSFKNVDKARAWLKPD